MNSDTKRRLLACTALLAVSAVASPVTWAADGANGANGAAGTTPTVSPTTILAPVNGVNGGNGGDATANGNGGGGGVGGDGLQFGANGLRAINASTITGGTGGVGGAGFNGVGGVGGAGGFGVDVSGFTSLTMTNNTGANILGGGGGKGGVGGVNFNGGNGGAGAAGVNLGSAAAVLVNSGTITGGNGGAGGAGSGTGVSGNGGNAGDGVTVSATSVSITNSGIIVPGVAGEGGGLGAGVAFNALSGRLTNSADGQIQGGAGIGVDINAATTSLTNAGFITASTGTALDITGATLTTLINSGTLSATTGVALNIGALGDLAAFSNTGGTVTSANMTTGSLNIAADLGGLTIDGGLISNTAANNAAVAINLLASQTGAISLTAATTVRSDGAGAANSGAGVAVDLDIFTATLSNAGTIFGQIIGTTGAQTLTNTGNITGAINLGDGNNVLNFTSGTVNGTINTGANNDTLTQGAGTITGTISLGDGTNSLNQSGGTIAGNVNFGAGADTLISNGTITGNVFLFDGENSVTLGAGGLITGNVTSTGNFADTLIMTGASSISGAVNLADGNNLLTLTSGSAGTITTGSGDDTLTHGAGTLGAVNLGEGNNSLNQSGGTINGNVNFGSGNDTLINTGTITGAIMLGGGTNSLTNNFGGTITGAIAGGAGADTLSNAGTINNNFVLFDPLDSLTNTATGLIDGAAGIAVDIQDAATGFSNAGTISATTGIALNIGVSGRAASFAAGTLTSANTGGAGTFVVAADFAGLNITSGNIINTFAGGNTGVAIDVTAAQSGVIVIGAATIIRSDGAGIEDSGLGIAVDFNGNAGELSNSGTIFGQIVGGAGSQTVTNNGALTGAINLGADDDALVNSVVLNITGNIDLGSGNDTFTNTLSGIVNGIIDANAETVINAGTINGGVVLNDGDTLDNSGAINGGAGIAIDVQGVIANYTNTGTVFASTGVALNLASAIGPLSINLGALSSANTGTGGTIIVGANLAGLTLNSGTVTNTFGNGLAALPANNTGVAIDINAAQSAAIIVGAATTIRSDGSGGANSGAGVAVDFGGNAGELTNNSMNFFGQILGAGGIQTVNNTAALTGAVSLGAGADNVNNAIGATINGIVNMGADADFDLLTNAGIINGGIVIGTNDTLDNSGTIAGGAGIAVDVQGALEDFINTGTISATSGVALNIGVALPPGSDAGLGLVTSANVTTGTLVIGADLGGFTINSSTISNTALNNAAVAIDINAAQTGAIVISGDVVVRSDGAGGANSGAGIAVDFGKNAGALTVMGTVFGQITGDDGAQILINNNAITGAISLGLGDDAITNSVTGSITGNINLGDGANNLTQAAGGNITGNITGGAGIDTLTSLGSITGNVDLLAGANVATISGNFIGAFNATGGTVALSINTGGGDDSITHSAGDFSGNINLGDGTNSFTQTGGSLTGNLSGGTGVDTFTNAATINGGVVVGAGDALINSGLIAATSGIAVNVEGALAAYSNTGVISATSGFAVNIANGASLADNTNMGIVSATTGVALNIDPGGGDLGPNINAGALTSMNVTTGTFVIGADLGGLNITAGTISNTAFNNAAVAIDINAAQTGAIVIGAGATIRADGAGLANSGAGVAVDFGVNGAGVLTNNSVNFFGRILGAADSQTVINNAAITGAISLGGGSDTLINNAGFTITGAIDLGEGVDTFTNAGTVTGVVSMGTDADAETLTNTGVLGGAVIDDNDVLANTGSIATLAGIAVDVQGAASTLDNSGTISATTGTALNIGAGGLIGTINNTGTISATTGVALNIAAGGDLAAALAAGTISSANVTPGSGTFVIGADLGGLSIDSGVISNSAANAIATAIEITAGQSGAIIINGGSVIANGTGAGLGVAVDFNGNAGALTLTTGVLSGQILGAAGSQVITLNANSTGAISLGADADTVTIGAVTLTGGVDLGAGADIFTLAAGGTVSGVVNMGADADAESLTNAGTLGGAIVGAGDTLTNTGAIAATTGIAVDVQGALAALNNTGTITATTGTALNIAATGNLAANIDSGALTSANVTTGTFVIGADLGGLSIDSGTITNSAANNAAVAIDVNAAQTAAIVIGAGTAVRADGAGAADSGLGIAVDFAGNAGTLINNSNMVFGQITGAAGSQIVINNAALTSAISLGAGDDTLTNSATGTITAAINLGDGANLLTNLAGGVITGNITGGANIDTLTSAGSIIGNADLLAGANTATISGSFAGALNATGGSIALTVNTGAGNDSISHAAGALTGNINLGDGDNSFTQTGGSLTGNLTGGLGNDIFANSGTITGNIILGDGTNSYTQTTAGALTIGNITGGAGIDTLNLGGVTTGKVDLGGGANIFNLTGSTFTGSVSSSGGGSTAISIAANGVFNVNAASDTGTGALNVAAGAGALPAGILNVQASLTSSGALTNAGQVQIGLGATLSVGTMAPGGAYVFDISSPASAATSFGKLVVTGGNVNFTGATVTANIFANSFLANGAELLIATGFGTDAGGVAGTSGITVLDNSFLYNFTMIDGTATALGTDDGGDVYLRVGNILTSAGATPNNSAVAQVLASLGPDGDAALDAVQAALAMQTTAEGVNMILEQLIPAVDAGAVTGAMSAANDLLDVVDTQLSTARLDGGQVRGVSAGDNGKGARFWAQGFGRTADQDVRDGINAYEADSYGLAIGADTRGAGRNTVLGIALGFASTEVDSANANRNKTEIDSYQITAYGSMRFAGPNYFSAMAGYVFSDNDTTRSLAIPGVPATASGNYDSDQYVARMEVGRDIRRGTMTLTPSLMANYAHYNADDYTETGAGGAGLNVSTDSMNLFETGVGAALSWDLKQAGGGVLRPGLNAGYRYDFIRDELTAVSSFTGGGGAFVTTGSEPAEHKFNAGAGIKYFSPGKWEFTASYGFDYMEDYDAHSGMVRAGVNF